MFFLNKISESARTESSDNVSSAFSIIEAVQSNEKIKLLTESAAGHKKRGP